MTTKLVTETTNGTSHLAFLETSTGDSAIDADLSYIQN